MKAIVGLGNPGKKFEKTRHNVGFLVIENLKLKTELPQEAKVKKRTKPSSPIESFSDWENKKKFICEISQGEIAGKKIVLAKPQTFMNLSGKAVKLLTKSYKIEAESLFIIHDDLDLPLGKIRISARSSSAGHKGVESIIRELGTKNFVRFRIGIKPEKGDEDKSSSSPFAVARVIENRKQKIEDFVLKKFTKDEQKILKEVIEKTVEAIGFSLKEGVEKAMSRYNQ